MKASRLFSLVAMAALAVGCTQEEFVPAGENTAVDLSNRPSLGDVVLDMGAQTRMAIADGSSFSFAWANGDKIGASIIDEPKADDTSVSGKDFSAKGGLNFSSLSWTYAQYKAGVKKSLVADGPEYSAQEAGVDISSFYQTMEYVSSNYPYTYANGIFDTPANLVEGNYMFYAPYNPQLLMRERVKMVLPQVQDCSDDVMKTTSYKGVKGQSVSSTALDQFYKGTTPDFANAPVAVGYKFLAAPEDGELIKPSVAMTNLFAYPMFTIVNDFNGYTYGVDNKSLESSPSTHTMTIDSIQIYDASTSSSLFYTASIGSEEIAKVLKTDKEWDNNKLTTGAETKKLFDASNSDVVENYAGHVDNNLQKAKLTDVNTRLTYQKNHVTFVIDKELAPNGTYHFHAILPAANYEHNLSARVFVTIDGTRYVIAKAQLNTGSNPTNSINTSTIKDFTFVDEINGGEDCELVRGEHYPKAEIFEDGSAAKDFAGTMLTLNLGGGTAAFQLNTEGVAAGDNGFKDNADFINYLKAQVQRGVALTEVPALRDYERGEAWKKYSTGVTASAGNFAFAENTQCIIDAQLIKDLKQQTILGTAAEGVKLTLTETSLPIADDVKYTMTAESGKTKYTFTTLDENEETYEIYMTDGVELGDKGEELVSGINNIGDPNENTEALTVELKVKSGEKNAVVYLQGAASYETTATLKDCTGISAIYVNENTKLNVDCECTALVIAAGGEINISTNGSLTNENNEFANVTIINGYLRTINGTLGTGVKVEATLQAWPAQAIPAASKITDLTINVAVENNQFSIEQTKMNVFANLTNGVALTLGENIKGIVSANNVTLTNLKSLTSANSAAITWGTTNTYGITVSGVEIEGAKTTITKITNGTGVTYANNQ